MAEIKVTAGQSLQAAINNAQPGDVISVETGATFRGPIVLPNKSSSTEIAIQSSRAADLPQGRVNPSHAGLMPKILCPQFDQAVRTQPGASFYKFDSIEVSSDPSVVSTPDVTRIYDLVRLGQGRKTDEGSTGQTTLESVPHHIKLDRMYIHGREGLHFQRGISLNSMDTSVTRSYISECHAKGMDAQAICSWNTPGRLDIIDCFLEGSGENFLLGGSDAASEAFLPSNVRLLKSHLFKPLSWKGSREWTVKNLLEVKAGKNLLFDGNILENNWVDGQAGIAILFTVRNQEGSAPFSIILNVVYSNNVLKNSEGGALNFLGSDNEKPSQRSSGVLLKNNLFIDIGSNFLTINGYDDVTLDRNTHFQKGNLTTFYGFPSERFRYTSNLTVDHQYGIYTEAGIGNAGLAKLAPGSVWTGNVIAAPYDKAGYPAGNQYPATLDMPADFRSPITGVGCDIEALKAAQSGTVPAPAPIPTPAPAPAPTPIPQPSPDGTKAATITDKDGGVWTIGPNKETLRNNVHMAHGQGTQYKWLSETVYVQGIDTRWYKWGGSSWVLFGATEPGVTAPAPSPTPTPAPSPVPAPTLRKVAWPTGETKQNAIIEAQWKEKFRFKRHLSGAYAEFEKVG